MRSLLLSLLLVGAGCQTQPPAPAEVVASAEATPQESAADSLLAQLPALERRVAEGDTLALRSSLHLRRESDGHVGEELDIIIGSAIRTMPAPLLRALREADVPDHWLDGITGNLGPAYVDRFDAQREELTARRESLLTVTSPPLIEVRDRLVAELDTQLTRLP